MLPSTGVLQPTARICLMTTPQQPGWYDDPHDSNAQRYWDGQDWTPHRQRKPPSRSVTPTLPPPSSYQDPAGPPGQMYPPKRSSDYVAPLPPPGLTPTSQIGTPPNGV